jgi:4-hydroxybenzoate polyprenyltransferase
MTELHRPVADSTDNWVDGLAPLRLRPYLRLARLDRPIGSWLLLLPCWWSVALAAIADKHGLPNPWHLFLFFVGAFAMRGSGCTWNDIVDREIDGQVERTRSRPIPSGQVSVRNAVVLLLLQAAIGFIVLAQFNTFTILTGIASLGIVAIYPFMKRITYWPQIVLGLAFSWGALMGWTAVFASLDWPAILLYAGSISWVIAYDTIYAHQDREDDALLGLKSTALLFGPRTKPMLLTFFSLAVILIGAAGFTAGAGLVFAVGLAVFAAHLGWQALQIDIDDPGLCLVLFRSNRTAGFILFAALTIEAIARRAF